MVQSLTFIDCSNCRKRIRSNALKCHHCHHANLPTSSLSDLPDSAPQASRHLSPLRKSPKTEDYAADSHMADGGYDEDTDDFDYDEYLAEEFPSQATKKPKPRIKRWVWVTAWLLIFATLVPYLYYAIILAR